MYDEAMLAATRILLDDDAPFPLRHLASGVVADHGDHDDAATIFNRTLAAPDPLHCAPLMALGTRAMGERLLRTFIEGGRLREGTPDELLHVLGYLGVEEAEPVLWTAAVSSGDHYLSMSACLGLLHLPCTGREVAIADAIRGCMGRNLFPEFLPVLACKTNEPSLAEAMVESGATVASTDCNGGLLLGLALLGARDAFERALFDPRWEAVGTATGTRRYAFAGVRVLGLSLIRLHDARRASLEFADIVTLAGLLEERVRSQTFLGIRAALPAVDDDVALHRRFFSSSGLRDELTRLPGHEREREQLTRDIDEAGSALEQRVAAWLATDEEMRR